MFSMSYVLIFSMYSVSACVVSYVSIFCMSHVFWGISHVFIFCMSYVSIVRMSNVSIVCRSDLQLQVQEPAWRRWALE